jgi:DNA-binding transcriptional MerR regulator
MSGARGPRRSRLDLHPWSKVYPGPVGTYSIGAVAERSGFTASALRYYEVIGLVRPVSRTEHGYRLYDESTLRRLEFIAQAKELDCSLEEIADLVGLWEREECGPVQHRLHALVTDKGRSAQSRIAALGEHASHMQTAASRLTREPVAGPCGDGCACTEAARAVSAGPSNLSRQAPIACTLEPDDVTDRIASWHRVLGHALVQTTKADGTRQIEFDDALELTELAHLVEAEQRCCAFFSFTIISDHRGLVLQAWAPAGAGDAISILFGPGS